MCMLGEQEKKSKNFGLVSQVFTTIKIRDDCFKYLKHMHKFTYIF